MSKSIEEQVLALTKLKPKDGETVEQFTMRAVKKLHGASDEVWNSVPDPVQAWVNANMVADENNQPLQLLELPEAAADKPEQEPEPEAEAEVEEETAGNEEASEEEAEQEPVVAKSAKKSNGKKVPVAKPAKKVAAPKVAKAAKESGETRGRKPNIGPLNAKIKILVKNPPGREGTVRQKVFAKYQPGMTVETAHKAGVPYNFMRWHVAQGWIELKA